MTIHRVIRLTALLLAVALAVPAFAKPIGKTIHLSQPAKVGGTQLSVGQYRLLIDETKVSVHRHDQVVAEADSRWEERAEKARYDSVLIGSDGQVQEIRFAGKKRVLVLSTP